MHKGRQPGHAVKWTPVELAMFKTQLTYWWIALQPGWRKEAAILADSMEVGKLIRIPSEGQGLSRDDAYHQLQSRLGHGGPQGLALIISGLSWWGCHATEKDRHQGTPFHTLIVDVAWVLETLLSLQKPA